MCVLLLGFVRRAEKSWLVFDVRRYLEGAEGQMIMCYFQMRRERIRGSDQEFLGIFLWGFSLLFGWRLIGLN